MIQLSEVEAKVVLSQPVPSLLPFVPIMRGGEQETVIREALRLLQQDAVLSDLEPLLAFFARFVLASEVVAEIMRWDRQCCESRLGMRRSSKKGSNKSPATF